MKYVIGIDGRTQSTKVSIFDLQGNVVCQVGRQLKPLYLPTADVAEHPGDDLWESLCASCRELMEQFSGEPEEIQGIGLGSIRCCRTYLRADGSLAYPVINWMDKRLAKPYQRDLPEMRYLSTATGYLTVRLTGQFKDTAANYEGIYGPFDKKTWDWSPRPEDYAEYNISRENLMDLVMPGELLGRITPDAAAATGLPLGCPVFATANDKAVEGLGSGLLKDGSCLVSLGTYIGAMTRGSEYCDTAEHYWSNLSAIPHEYLYETMKGIRRGMWSVSWFRELLGEPYMRWAAEQGLSAEEALEKEAIQVPASSEGLITVGKFLSPQRYALPQGVFHRL